MTVDAVQFYRVGDPWGEFSNFYLAPIDLDGFLWLTVEHYFQANKFVGAECYHEIRQIESPMLAARKGRDRSLPLRADWENVKDQVMRRAVLAKFSQHHDLRAVLLSTGIRSIVEHTTNDSYWGDGGDGSGRNRLGQILEEVREGLT